MIDCPLQISSNMVSKHLAIVCGENTITYEDLHSAACAASQTLKDFGVQEGSRVAIFNAPHINYIIAILALLRLKAVACPLSTRLPENGLNQNLQNINCDFLISSLDNILTSNKIKIKKVNLDSIIIKNPVNLQVDTKIQYQYKIDQDATILFTSGSTKEPKAALHTIGNHYFSAKGSNENISVKPRDRWLLSLPLFHVGGLGILFRVLLGHGTLVIPAPGQNVNETIVQQKITHLSLVPTQLFRLLQDEKVVQSLKNIKAILLGGTSIPKRILDTALTHKLPVHITYGLTEMCSQVATSEPITDNNPNVQVLNHRAVKISEDGEVLVKGDTLFKGYIEGNNLIRPVTPQGWFQTGDLGNITEEGNLFIYGRRDNMFISGGENIQPEEIEFHLCSLESIEQAIVVPIKNEEFGFRPIAFLKTTDDGQVSVEEITSLLINELPKFKIPELFFNWPTYIEETEVKVNRNRLIELAENKNPDLKPI